MTDTKTREAVAITAALLLARLAQLRFDSDPGAPMLPFRNYLYADSAGLLLVPTIEPVGRDNAMIDAAVELHGHDALVVRAAGRDPTDITFDVVLAGEPTAWSTPLSLWLSASGAVYLLLNVPDTTIFALQRTGLRDCKSPPWVDDIERVAGLLRGQRELTRALEGC